MLGVDPGARRLGLATALLRRACRIWVVDGIERAELTVASDNPGAQRLYERLGVDVTYTLDCYERPLSSLA